MRSAECGMRNVRVTVARPTTFHCNSAFRIPHSAFLRPRRHNFGYVDRGRIGRFASVRSGIRTDPSQWTDERHRRGIAGEEQAIRYLLSRGCTIVAHRFRVGHTEIDLIARQGDLVTFVEVKTRRGRAFGSPLEAVTGAKRRELVNAPRVRVEVIPTGAINLDAAIGIGGIPRGRVTEIFGPESSGKTTLALHVVANAQRQGGAAAYIDAEHALDVEYVKKLGVDIDNLLVSQPDTGGQGLEITEILVRSGAVDVVVVDSVAALVPKAEIEGEMGDSLPGLQARLMSQALRKLAGAINRSRTAVVFINQLREKIGILFGNPETTSGGRALKFYASVRLDMRRIGPVKERDVVIGNHVRVKVVKNKVAPPFRQAEFDLMFDEGISHESLLVDIAAEAGIIEKSGAWYAYGKERIGQGRENAKLYLKDHPDLAVEVEAKVKEHLGVKPVAVAADEEASAPEE